MKGLCSYRLKNGGLSHNVLELRFYDSVSLSFKIRPTSVPCFCGEVNIKLISSMEPETENMMM